MSWFPDCRTDEYYNQKYLGEKDAEFLAGCDFALMMIDSLFNNLEIYYDDFEFDDEDINLARFLDKHDKIRERLQEAVKDWYEMERNQLVASMIDGMDQDDYDTRKQEVDGGAKSYFRDLLK